MALGLMLALGLSVLVALALLWTLKRLMPLIVNGVLGLAIFWVLSQLGLLRIPLDATTFLIAALGGMAGVLIVVVLAALGVPL